eukprot:g9049.t1
MSRYTEAKVFVGNLRRDVQKEDLQPLFQAHGDVLNVWVAKNPPGFAFITFRDENEASKAVEKLHGFQAGPAPAPVAAEAEGTAAAGTANATGVTAADATAADVAETAAAKRHQGRCRC